MTKKLPHSRTLLVVDDQEENLQVLGTILNFVGYDLIPAFSAKQALQRLKARLPDLILLDIGLPDQDGIELCRTIKLQPAWAEIPIIFVSASDDRNLIVRALETGGVDYVTKPFHKAELISRVRTHIAIKESREAVKAMAADKEVVLGMLAHDFKNFLSGLQVSSQLLLRRSPEGDARSWELLTEIERSSGRMLAFIQDFLANQAASSTEISPTAFDAGAVIRQALRAYGNRAKAKKITLTSEWEEDTFQAMGDAHSFRQVLENLLSNGVKFSPEGGWVKIRGSIEKSRLIVIVEDSGPGFHAEEYPQVFRRYAKLSAAPTGAEPSTGLGLSIAKELMTRMEGTLDLQSVPDEGARFRLSLPLPSEISSAC